MKKILLPMLVLGVVGCSLNQSTTSPQIAKNNFDGSSTISYKPSNIVCDSLSLCPNIGFAYNTKSKDYIGVNVVVPSQIKAINELSINIDGNTKTFRAQTTSDITLLNNYNYSAQTFLVPTDFLAKSKVARTVTLRIAGPSYIQDGSLRTKKGEKILAARNLDALLEQLK
ncbi:hypothetical protein PY247_10655 [Acinetobacter proteolyticus]|nr:hypothetical protein [Acinetobacter proteolyticus]WEI20133.1 hypothetical protein PY247_10655 [Acinetobacter proteolyticus]